MRTTSRALTKSSALEPENPVRYRMLAGLVTSKPSRCAAVRPPASAARRRGRESDTGGESSRQSAQPQLVSVCSESRYHSHGGRREHRMTTLGLTGIDIRQMHFDEWHRDLRQRIAQRDARVGVRPGVDDHAVDLAAPPVQRVDHFAFAIVLRELHLCSQLGRHRGKRTLDVVQRLAAVQCRLASAEEIQVRAIEDGDPHVFFSPLSHALNCAISSLGRCVPSPELSGLSAFAASPAKNWSSEKAPAAPLPFAGVAERKTWSSESSSVAGWAGVPRRAPASVSSSSLNAWASDIAAE